MFHTALTIFHPHNNKQYDYLQQLARVRIENFTAQEEVTEMTLVTCIAPKTKTFLDLLLPPKRVRKFKKLDVYVLSGKEHAGNGYTQALVEPETEWVYFGDDGHVLPIRKNSVSGWFQDACTGIGTNEFDVLVEASRRRDEPILKREHLAAYSRWLGSNALIPTIQCQEWGYYQRASTVRKFWCPPQCQRTQNGTFFLHQGARVAFSNARSAWFIHHGLSVGPSSFALFNPSQAASGLCSIETDPNWNFAEQFKKVLREKLLKRTPIRKKSYREGELISEEDNYLPTWV